LHARQSHKSPLPIQSLAFRRSCVQKFMRSNAVCCQVSSTNKLQCGTVQGALLDTLYYGALLALYKQGTCHTVSDAGCAAMSGTEQQRTNPDVWMVVCRLHLASQQDLQGLPDVNLQ
jgi:hypothetical protein